MKEVSILDAGVLDGEFTLLDGEGRPLPTDALPKYLTFRPGEVQKNSLGQKYAPQYEWGNLTYSPPLNGDVTLYHSPDDEVVVIDEVEA